jgi:hypothetical protein
MSVRRTNRFWSVSLEHTLFLDFLKLFVNMRLALSLAGKQKLYFLDLRIKSYGCLKFQGEVWAGRACAGANQQELTTCTKSGGQEEKKIQEKWELPHRCRCRPAAGGRPLVASRPWATDLRVAISGRWDTGDQRSRTGRCRATRPRPLVAARRSMAQGLRECFFGKNTPQSFRG